MKKSTTLLRSFLGVGLALVFATSAGSAAELRKAVFGYSTVGAMAVELTLYFRGGGALQASDFPPAFLAVALISALSVLIFAQLSPEAGAEMADARARSAGTGIIG